MTHGSAWVFALVRAARFVGYCLRVPGGRRGASSGAIEGESG
jgi:hypothetical protein